MIDGTRRVRSTDEILDSDFLFGKSEFESPALSSLADGEGTDFAKSSELQRYYSNYKFNMGYTIDVKTQSWNFKRFLTF